MKRFLHYVEAAAKEKDSGGRVNWRKYKNVLTPSGYSDNGLMEISDNIVSLLPSQLRKAIVEEKTVKTRSGSVQAGRITIGDQSWLVEIQPYGDI